MPFNSQEYAQLVSIGIINEILSCSKDGDKIFPADYRRKDYSEQYGVLVSISELGNNTHRAKLAQLLLDSKNNEVIYPDTLEELEKKLNGALKCDGIETHEREAIERAIQSISIEEAYSKAMDKNDIVNADHIVNKQVKKRRVAFLTTAPLVLIGAPLFYLLAAGFLFSVAFALKVKNADIPFRINRYTAILVPVVFCLYLATIVASPFVGAAVGAITGFCFGLYYTPSIIKEKLQRKAPGPSGERVQHLLFKGKSGTWNSDWTNDDQHIPWNTRQNLTAKTEDLAQKMLTLNHKILGTANDVFALSGFSNVVEVTPEISHYLTSLKSQLQQAQDEPNYNARVFGSYATKVTKWRERHDQKTDRLKLKSEAYTRIEKGYTELSEIVRSLQTCKTNSQFLPIREKLDNFPKSEHINVLGLKPYQRGANLDSSSAVQNVITHPTPPTANNSNNITQRTVSKKRKFW
jgi:hypothetical protein